MSQKSKGSNAERELIHLFHAIEGWSAVRVAGSGSNKYPCPDIVAGNGERYLAIECKATREATRYIEKEDLEQLSIFGQRFGAEAWLGVRFMNEQWYFLKVEELKDTGKNVAISKELAQTKGRTFNQLIYQQEIARGLE